MKKIAIAITALCCVAAWAESGSMRPEPKLLPQSAYRVPLDEVIVEGRGPYWRAETPRWDKPKVEAPKPDAAAAGRMQWLPRYTRDERDEYNEPRDQLNPKARARIFEIRF